MIKQLVPREACLNCKGCCRFKEADSVWSPCLLDEEIQDLLDQDIPAADISINKRLRGVQNKEADGFICPFLGLVENKCMIYSKRPMECQLYPFLISIRGKKIILTVDLNCPFVKENINSKGFKTYTEYLAAYLNSPAQLKLLKENPHVIQAYEEVQDILELNL